MSGKPKMEKKGSLDVIIGCMFSGKTTELLRRMNRLLVSDKSVLLVKYRKDTRYSAECVASHNTKLDYEPAVPIMSFSELFASYEIRKYDCVIVDEAHFIPDVVSGVKAILLSGVDVILAALQGDYRKQLIGKTHELFPIARSIDQLRAICMACKSKEAHLSMRIAGDSHTVEDIGGKEKYKAVCDDCFEQFT